MKAQLEFRRFQILSLGALIGLLGLWAGIAQAQDAYTEDPRVETARLYREHLGAPGQLDKILATGVVRIAVPEDLPLYGSAGAERKLEGYDIDVAQLLAKDLGVKLELVPVKSVDRIPSLMTGRVDLVIANLGISPERAKSIAFSSPYAPFSSGVFGPVNVNVKSTADLQGKKVAVTRDTLEDQELSKIAPKDAQILRFEDNNGTISAFLSGQVDVIVTGSSIAAGIAKKNPDKKLESKLVLKESPSGIGLRRNEPELLNWVNVFVFHKKLSGELDQLSRKWFGEPLRPLPPL